MALEPIQRINPGKRLSDAVVHDSTIYLAGQVATDPSVDIKAQARDILAQIDDLLGELGSSKRPPVVCDDLSRRHGRLCRDERSLGRVGAAGQPAGARDGAGEARQAGIQHRNPGDRRDSSAR